MLKKKLYPNKSKISLKYVCWFSENDEYLNSSRSYVSLSLFLSLIKIIIVNIIIFVDA